MTFDHRHLIVLGSVALLGLSACEKKENADQTQTTGATRTNPENTTVQPTTSNTTPGSQVNMPERGTGTTTTTGMERDANDAVIDRITDARCKHEVSCNNLGAGKKWNDEAACKREVRQNLHADLRQSECKNVLQDKVQTCIDEINGEKCGSVVDLGRANACRKGTLCKD